MIPTPDAADADRAPRKAPSPAWITSGLILLAIFLVLSQLSHRFVYGSDMTQRPILTLVALLMIAAAVYLFLWLRELRRHQGPITPRLLFWIITVGLGMRLLMFPSLPMLEDDYHRYLWDGAVAASGHNPYGIVPAHAQTGSASIPDEVIELGKSSGLILERVNHPHLKTVYPPVAASVFALAHLITPWSMGALRALYLLFDFAVVFLLWQLLGRLESPRAWIAIYWWNPLFVKEIYNSGHMDLLLIPFALVALYLATTNRYAAAAVALALAVAAKLWPVLLAPVLFAKLLSRPGQLVLLAAGFLVLIALLLSPMLPALAQDGDSGLVAYSEGWEMNDALFMVFPWALRGFAGAIGIDPEASTLHRLARMISAAIVLLVVGWVTFRRKPGPEAMAGGALAVVATLFLVSPTQFPWYFAWVLPFLTLRPRFSLLLLTLMLPLYYLKFYYDAHDSVDFFHYRIVWLEYAPVWIALGVEGVVAWRSHTRSTSKIE